MHFGNRNRIYILIYYLCHIRSKIHLCKGIFKDIIHYVSYDLEFDGSNVFILMDF